MEQDFLIQDIKREEAQKHARKVRDFRVRKPLWREYAETAAIALIAAVLLRFFVVSAYKVTSSSMEDALYEGDYIFVNKLAYKYGGAPKPGDVIVFKYPMNPEKDYIKRIVALPGQEVQIADKIVYIDGQPATIPIFAKNTDRKILPADLSFRDNFGPYVVPMGEYFVMGDNRDDSRDSRFWGCVPEENLLGKAIFVYWSWEPDPDAPEWKFPYVIETVQWLGYAIFNFPSHVRWDRLGIAI